MFMYAILAVGLVIASVALFGLLYTPPGEEEEGAVRVGAIDVYLQPTCGCCHLYMEYLRGHGFDVTAHAMADLAATKAHHGIPRVMQSCHTAVWGPYFVEGHVPMAALSKLVEEGPVIEGIALPGMPAGSPGMGGVKGAPLVIYALVGGQATVFMEL
ncbi:MAG: DUF411 domain-containing protein [Thermoplasmata archaeon]